MNSSTFISGLIAGIVSAITYIILLITGQSLDTDHFENAQVIGYLLMIIGLSTIFFAVKQYRDKHLGGKIKFGKAFLIGIYVTLIAGLIYVISWELYFNSYGSEFSEKYVEHLTTKMAEEGASQSEIDKMIATSEETMEVYNNNTPMRMAITFLEIFPVGLIVSLISATIFGVFLNKKE